jgi:hypothetical protein
MSVFVRCNYVSCSVNVEVMFEHIPPVRSRNAEG